MREKKVDWDRIVRIGKVLREENLMCKDVAAKAEMNIRDVSRIIRGTRKTKWREEKIAHVLGYTWDELFNK